MKDFVQMFNYTHNCTNMGRLCGDGLQYLRYVILWSMNLVIGYSCSGWPWSFISSEFIVSVVSIPEFMSWSAISAA